MSRFIIRIVVICAVLTCNSYMFPNTRAQAADSVPKESSQKVKVTKIPFRGKLHSFDKQARSITLAGKTKNRTLRLMEDVKVVKGGKKASLDDAVAGEEVGGQLYRFPDGREEVASLRLGAKPEKAPTRARTRKKEDPAGDQ